MSDHIATAELDIAAPPERIWTLLTRRGPDPDRGADRIRT